MPLPTGVAPAVVDGVDVDAVAAAVAGCPGVSALDGGQYGEAVTYLPGRTVAGVVVDGGRVRVRVRSRWGVPATDLAALITAAVAPLAGGRPVDVMIGDVDDPPPDGPEAVSADTRPGRPGRAAVPGRRPPSDPGLAPG